MEKIGIIGQGFVGNAIYQSFKNFFELYTFDLDKNKSNTSFEILTKKCKVIFICLPTPMNSDGSCNSSIVSNELKKLNKIGEFHIVIKSTVEPGTTEKFNNLYKKLSIVFNPEFLTERNAVNDFKNQNRIILGGPKNTTTRIKQLYSVVFPNAHIIKTGSTHAEMIKYLTNSFLATKVIFANEIYQLCNSLNLDYDKVIEYSIIDQRLGNTHWQVPGPDGDFGFGGHCFPKDIHALKNIFEKNKLKADLLKSVIEKNNKIRENRDWEKMKGRAVN